MLRARFLVPLALTALLMLAACAAQTTGAAVAPSTPARTSPTPAPVVGADTLTYTLDGFRHTLDGTDGMTSFDDVTAVLDLIESLAGVAPSVEEVEDPWGDGELFAHRYVWDEVTVLALVGSESASVSAQSPVIGSVPISTAEGISVGDTREQVTAAGAVGESDEDADGELDVFSLGARDVEGTQSLANPDATGREYILVRLEGDTVTSLQVGDDFSDL